MSARYNYLQPIYLNYEQQLIQDIAGYMMPFPNLEKFNLHYGKPEEKAPTTPLLDTIRLLLPQIRVINNLTVNSQPNPAAFLAYQPVSPNILALIFKRWVEVCYPESEHLALLPLCEKSQFNWTEATSEHLEYWAPSWAVALELTKYNYQLGGDSFQFLFGPGRRANTVELVSWPPFTHARGYRTSVAVTISTQSDLDDTRKINLHFSMKRWMVKQGNKLEVQLQKNTTECYVRRLRSWLGDYNLLEPNAFTILKANYRKEGDIFIPQWKSQQLNQILQRLSVEIPDITEVLRQPSRFIETNQIDILIPARSYQKAGWGTGVPFAEQRNLLKQIIDVLPSDVVLTKPWRKIPITGNLNKSLKQKFQETPKIARPSKGKLPQIDEKLRGFLRDIANNRKIRVYWRTEEVKEALARVAQHYFGDSLTLEFQSLKGLADPIPKKESKRNKKTKIPDPRHIRKFGQKQQSKVPTPIIVEILPKDHPAYRNGQDPKNYIKSILPEYNLIPQCIVSSETLTSDELEFVESNEETQKNIDNRALNSIIDAILPFTENYPLSPLSIGDGESCNDNSVYAGFYVIRRNNKTAKQSFSQPVLVAIYKNLVSVLLPAIDLTFRSMADAICELARQKTSKKVNQEQVISNMLSTLAQIYSSAEDIYLFVHGQNARKYWPWLQDSKFDPANPPSNKIHIIRIRDQSNYEVPQGYGLPTEQETFAESNASFLEGIFIPDDCDLKKVPFTQTVLSVAKKPETTQQGKNLSRFENWTSRTYEKEENKDGKMINKRDPKTGKCIVVDKPQNPLPSKVWKAPQPRADNILATPSPENFELHHAITHDLRSRHWWTSAECEYPLPLSLAAKLKEWCFNDAEED